MVRGYTVLVYNQSLMPTQPPTLSWTGNEYQPKVRLRSAAVEYRQVWFIPLVDKRVGGR